MPRSEELWSTSVVMLPLSLSQYLHYGIIHIIDHIMVYNAPFKVHKSVLSSIVAELVSHQPQSNFGTFCHPPKEY